ncbi:MAG: CPBP family intramembrane metalloprotease [Syntrophales bacterium]|nr:CPBP family intramembrane metalloprotease [Syntrophales bacterium]
MAVVTPAAAALFMIFSSESSWLKNDFLNRMFNVKLLYSGFVLFALLVMPFSVSLATGISLLFGEPAHQFAFSTSFFSMGGAPVMVWLIAILLAPTFEEIGWKGYGVDSLTLKGRSLFVSTLLFALLWAVWHLPLFSIRGYYHNSIMHANILYAVNFFVSIFPIAFLCNWVFYRTNRSILACIAFHAMANLSMSVLNTGQVAKCIVTVILIVIALIVIVMDKPLWFEKK